MTEEERLQKEVERLKAELNIAWKMAEAWEAQYNSAAADASQLAMTVKDLEAVLAKVLPCDEGDEP